MTKKIEEGTAFNIFNRTSGAFDGLISFVDSITDDTYRKHEREILEYLGSGRFEEFRKGLEEQNSKLRARAKKVCGDALSAIAAADAEDMIQRNILNPLRAWADSGLGSAPSATVLKCAADIAAAYKKPKRKTDPQPPREALDAPIAEALDTIVSAHARLTYITLLRNNVYYLGLLSFVSGYMRRFRLENSTILLSDTNALLSAIIGDTDSPFLYEKIGTRFENYLIDEFQDTSFSQWHNLEPLVRESAASGGDNLVIGDEKQSIYRFRGSDSTLLHNLDTTMGDVETEVRGTRIEENTNWRSSVEVIQFNNTLFTAMSGLAGVGDIYDSVAQHVSPKNFAKHGYVAMKMTQAAPNDREKFVLPALEFMATNLRRQLESGYRPGDIAILVRRRSEGEEVIAYLQELQAEDPTFPSFNIVSDQSFLVSRSPAVRLVVSTLRYLTALEFNPRRHKRSRKEVARVQTDFEARYAESETASQSLEEALAALEARRNAETDIPEPIEAKAIESVDLFSLVEEIIHTIPAKRRAEEAVFITAFQDMVVDFINHGNSDIRAFLQWWDERGANISVAGAEDPTAIKVLTMHKSKGLEFPCVHVPFAALAQTGGAGRDRAWFRVPPVDGIPADIQPELMPLEIVSAMASTPLAGEYAEIQKKRQLDFLNLLYVALTRAVDELIVSLRTQESDGTGPELPINRLIMGAISKADAGFRALCEADVTLRPGEPSPFITLADKLDGDTLTIGSPTHRTAEQKKPRPALEPEEGECIADYRTSEARNPWKHTRVDHERVNAIP
ncbi:MAG: UvrD-helicase domain-containing protein, partial [Duncaniella sp.]|nr:UvrD-helicase domain-containing protein [Duncaniella sp.]